MMSLSQMIRCRRELRMVRWRHGLGPPFDSSDQQRIPAGSGRQPVLITFFEVLWEKLHRLIKLRLWDLEAWIIGNPKMDTEVRSKTQKRRCR